MADGSVAVALTNAGDTAEDVGTTAKAAGLPQADCYRVRDLWAHTERKGTGDIGPMPVPSHAVSMFRVWTCN